jgi:hypothetical protein
MMTVRLERNRSPGPVLSTHLIFYRRETVATHGRDRVVPYRVTEKPGQPLSGQVIPWSELRGCDVDPEFEDAWLEHVRQQSAA